MQSSDTTPRRRKPNLLRMAFGVVCVATCFLALLRYLDETGTMPRFAVHGAEAMPEATRAAIESLLTTGGRNVTILLAAMCGVAFIGLFAWRRREIRIEIQATDEERIDTLCAPTGKPPTAQPRSPVLADVAAFTMPEPEESPGTALAQREEPFLLLCIDDDPNVARSIEKGVDPEEIAVHSAKTAEDGYLEAFDVRPDAILLSTALPNTDPHQAIDKLRTHPFLADVPVILMEDHAKKESTRRASIFDKIVCIKKPIDIDKLRDECEHLASRCDSELILEQTASGKGWANAASTAGEEMRNGNGSRNGNGGQNGSTPADTAVAVAEENGDLPTLDSDATDATDAEPGVDRPRVLCIDDDPNVSKAIAVRLKPYGVDVIRAFNGMQGFWTALDMRPDVIIVDMKMPDGGGNYIYSRLQSHPITEGVPVIVLTGDTNQGLRRMMLGQGVAAYFLKPWDPNELLEALRRFIDI